MDIRSLYELARKENIPVLTFPMPENGSMSILREDGSCVIGMDAAMQDGAAEEMVHLGHEMGHCLTGSFYNIHAALDCRQKHENRADKWAVEQLIPVEALDEAVAGGCTEIWELAEYFGVTEDFIKKALCYYVHGNMAAELYF